MANIPDFQLIKSFYHISPEGVDHPLFELPALQWSDTKLAEEALLELGKLWKATDRELPVSFAGMTLFHLCIMNFLFAAQYNQFLKLPLRTLTFQLEKHNDHAHTGYKISELNLLDVPQSGEARVRFLDEAWRHFIGETVIPGVEAFAAAGGVKSAMIWNQFGAGIHSIRAYARKHIAVPGLNEQLDADFPILEALPGEIFNRRRNPFLHTPRYIDNPWDPPEGKYILRSSCCMYDRRDNGVKCYNCPRMLPEEREERRQKALAEAK